MLREVLIGKIHRAVVTDANLDYEGSITIDESLLATAGILPYQVVQIWDVTSGNRLNTYVIPTNTVGVVCINGAAAHLIKKKDIIITEHAEIQAYVREIELEEVKNNIVNPEKLVYASEQRAENPDEEKYFEESSSTASVKKVETIKKFIAKKILLEME